MAKQGDGWFAKAEYGLCRAVTGHAWEFVRRVLVVTKNDASIRLRCLRCQTERDDFIDLRTGAVDHKYRHPKDYKLRLGDDEDAPKKAVMRRAAVAVLKQEAGK